MKVSTGTLVHIMLEYKIVLDQENISDTWAQVIYLVDQLYNHRLFTRLLLHVNIFSVKFPFDESIIHHLIRKVVFCFVEIVLSYYSILVGTLGLKRTQGIEW